MAASAGGSGTSPDHRSEPSAAMPSGADGHGAAGTDRQPRERGGRDGRERRERAEQTNRAPDGQAPENAGSPDRSASNVGFESSGRAQTAIDSVATTERQNASATGDAQHEPASTASPAPVRPTGRAAGADRSTRPAAAQRPQPEAAPASPAPSSAAPQITLPKVGQYDLPLQDLSQVAQGSGLQWVNSDAAKIAEAQSAIAAEVKAPHVPRERQAAVTDDAGPLVLVETRRDLGATTLPFEKPASAG